MKTAVLYQRPFKNNSLHVAKQYVPPYSLSNAVALDLEEELQKNMIKPSKVKKKLKLKTQSTGRLTTKRPNCQYLTSLSCRHNMIF